MIENGIANLEADDGRCRQTWRVADAKRYVYCWADGIHLEARLEQQAQCILVIIGATPEGKKGTHRLHRRAARELTIVA